MTDLTWTARLPEVNKALTSEVDELDSRLLAMETRLAEMRQQREAAAARLVQKIESCWTSAEIAQARG